MPLLKSNSKEAQHKNYLELTMGQVGEIRHKSIATIMRRRNISYEKARAIQASAITRK